MITRKVDSSRKEGVQRVPRQEIVDVIPQTITVLDADGTIIYANQAVLDYTGLTLADVMKPDFRERVFPLKISSDCARTEAGSLARFAL